jgi:hypothetical protein
MFRRQFETVAEYNRWMLREKVTYLIAALQGRAYDVLHGFPREATYEETIEAREDRFGDQHLAAAYRSQLKTRTEKAGDPRSNLPPPLSSWPTEPTLHYQTTRRQFSGSIMFLGTEATASNSTPYILLGI